MLINKHCLLLVGIMRFVIIQQVLSLWQSNTMVNVQVLSILRLKRLILLPVVLEAPLIQVQ